mgnify:FL=1
MIGYSPKFPLQINNYVGAYALTATLAEVAKQNFINLMLTAPGERIMDINFGVGLRRYLFEQNTPGLHTQISRDISSQTETYLPFIELEKIVFNQSQVIGGVEDQILEISISYSVPSIGVSDSVLIGISS